MLKSLHLALIALFAVCASAFHISAFAVTQTSGAGSAVTSTDTSAFFENNAALNGNPYLEGGLSFSRTELSFNNNGCGFAGCSTTAGLSHFSGNYMYGAGSGYFEIATTGGSDFSGLEFVTGSGGDTSEAIVWSAYNNGVQVGGGSATLDAGDIVGFSDSLGFDVLRYTSSAPGHAGSNLPAFDTVHAQFTISAVPEPEVYATMMAGLGLMGFVARRRRVKSN